MSISRSEPSAPICSQSERTSHDVCAVLVLKTMPRGLSLNYPAVGLNIFKNCFLLPAPNTEIITLIKAISRSPRPTLVPVLTTQLPACLDMPDKNLNLQSQAIIRPKSLTPNKVYGVGFRVVGEVGASHGIC